MYSTTFTEFEALSKEFNLIPVCVEIPADMETPLSVSCRFLDDENFLLLESVEQAERFGRYSFVAINPRGIFEVSEKINRYTQQGQCVSQENSNSGILGLRELFAGLKAPNLSELPPFFGGAAGYIGYETINEFEELPPRKKTLDNPDSMLMIVDEMIAFDNLKHTMKLIVCIRTFEHESTAQAYRYAQEKIQNILQILKRPCVLPQSPITNDKIKLQSFLSKDQFCSMVEGVQRHIHDGDAIQVVLSQKFTAHVETAPIYLYRALRLINPSPYMFLLKLQDHYLIGSSPETMVKLQKGRSSLRPIAGTRRRGKTAKEDSILANDLLNDEKERSEHLMLLDLGRNDLGRTAAPCSVQVKSYMHVERYSHVMHLVSDIDAVLNEPFDAFDLLKTTFPAGTLSGAPKIRAMELINEYEPQPRGVYGGAVGYFGYGQDMDLAITIRTLELNGQELTIQSGAGIVYDSIPEKEYEETLNKAAAMFEAVKFAQELAEK